MKIKEMRENNLWSKKKNWREKIAHIRIPGYLKEDLEEYFNYIKVGDNLMSKATIDNVISSINVAEQENDLSSEEATYIRKIL